VSTDPSVDRLIDGNDLDELVREVDRRTGDDDWEGLVRLRDKCRTAFERGFQLWPAASLAEYRLALRAPAPWAASVLVEGAGHLSLGPLTEVAASTHTWAELAPHLSDDPLAGVFAHERVVRGEDLSAADVPFADVFDLPLAIARWEPAWPVATYGDSKVDWPRPPLPRLNEVTLPPPGSPVDDPESDAALRAVVRPWVAQSNGRVETACVEGSALAAVAALGVPAARAVDVAAGDALAQVAWAAGGGGAHGRRRGAAVGRDLAWRCADALVGVDGIGELRWFAWDDALTSTGWDLRLAVEDPHDGVAWAIAATDVD